MSKILIVGDLHLGKNLNLGRQAVGSQLSSRAIDQLNSLTWILQQAIDRDVDHIIFTGDMTEDPKPNYFWIEEIIKFIKQCEIYGIDLHIVAGNHDLKRTGQFYDSYLDLITQAELPNATIYKEMDTLHLEKESITFLPFRDRRGMNYNSNQEALDILEERISYQVKSIPKGSIAIAIGHYALAGSLFVGDEIDDMANELIVPLNFFSEYNYTWMGHVHKPQVLAKNPHIAHIGSVDISNFGECDQKKILIYWDGKGFEEIIIPNRRMKKINIIVPLEVDATEFIITQLAEETDIPNSIVKLEVKLENPSAAVDRAKVEQYMQEVGVHCLPIFTETRTMKTINSQVQSVESDLTYHQIIQIDADNQKFATEEQKAMYIKFATSVIERLEQ